MPPVSKVAFRMVPLDLSLEQRRALHGNPQEPAFDVFFRSGEPVIGSHSQMVVQAILYQFFDKLFDASKESRRTGNPVRIPVNWHTKGAFPRAVDCDYALVLPDGNVSFFKAESYDYFAKRRVRQSKAVILEEASAVAAYLELANNLSEKNGPCFAYFGPRKEGKPFYVLIVGSQGAKIHPNISMVF